MMTKSYLLQFSKTYNRAYLFVVERTNKECYNVSATTPIECLKKLRREYKDVTFFQGKKFTQVICYFEKCVEDIGINPKSTYRTDKNMITDYLALPLPLLSNTSPILEEYFSTPEKLYGAFPYYNKNTRPDCHPQKVSHFMLFHILGHYRTILQDGGELDQSDLQDIVIPEIPKHIWKTPNIFEAVKTENISFGDHLQLLDDGDNFVCLEEFLRDGTKIGRKRVIQNIDPNFEVTDFTDYGNFDL